MVTASSATRTRGSDLARDITGRGGDRSKTSGFDSSPDVQSGVFRCHGWPTGGGQPISGGHYAMRRASTVGKRAVRI